RRGRRRRLRRSRCAQALSHRAVTACVRHLTPRPDAPAACIIVESMDPTIHPRLRAWLDRSEIVALDPPRIETLARSLDDADPPVRVERWGTVVGYEAGPPRRPLGPCDRHAHPPPPLPRAP